MATYWRMFARQWFLIVLIAALTVAGAAAYSTLATPRYSSDVRLFVGFNAGEGSPTDMIAGAEIAQQRVASYVELVDSPVVLGQVIERLSLPYTVEELSENISAETTLSTVNIVVTVTDTDPGRAAATADAFAPVFADYLATVDGGARDPAQAPVRLSVTRPASVATTPDSPLIWLNLGLGLFVGLGLGLVAAFVRDQTNSLVMGIRDVEQITGAVPLGVIPHDRATARRPLVQPAEHSLRAEAFRSLRANLQFASVDNPPGTIVITSAVAGEGKSTASANIALTLAVGGAKVALVEADLREPALSGYLGISNAAGLTNVLAGQYTLAEVLIRHRSDNLAVLTSGPKPPNPAELLNSTQMENLLSLLGQHFDYVVIDSPPLLRAAEAAVLSAITDGALLVVAERRTRRDQLDRAVRSLTTVNARVLGTVLNFASGQKGDQYGYPRSAGADPRHTDNFFPQGDMPDGAGVPDEAVPARRSRPSFPDDVSPPPTEAPAPAAPAPAPDPPAPAPDADTSPGGLRAVVPPVERPERVNARAGEAGAGAGSARVRHR